MPVLPSNPAETHAVFLNNEYLNLQNLIFKYDQAISALLTGTHQSYELDTGQSRQRVTRLDLEKLQSTRKLMLSELDDLAARLGKTNSVKQVRPHW